MIDCFAHQPTALGTWNTLNPGYIILAACISDTHSTNSVCQTVLPWKWVCGGVTFNVSFVLPPSQEKAGPTTG